MSGIVGDNLFRASGVVATSATDYDDDQIQSNIAVLGFYVAVNGSLVRYNLVDQSIDEYFDTSGVDAPASTNETRSLVSPYYYYGSAAVTPTITEDADDSGVDGDYTWYAWTDTASTGSYQTNATQNVDLLVIAGGGAGGGGQGGGAGGAGGFKYFSGYTAVGTSANVVTIGAGGASRGGTGLGDNGVDSSFSSLTATGGGGGASGNGSAPQVGADGGSGGGGGFRGNNAGGSGTANQGNDGGNSTTPTTPTSSDTGGGGGGASAVGTAGSPGGPGGAGGAGYTEGSSTVYDWTLADGTTATFDIDGVGTIYAGGGGGGSETGPAGPAGSGGGGAGGVAGTANTGGGGGGGHGTTAYPTGAGGSGIVILRRLTDGAVGAADLTLQSTDVTAETAPDFSELVMLIENSQGTATMNTDIKGYVSRDSGTTFTQGTLVDEGTWGTNKQILGFHDLDISGQPSGTSMCYKIETLNQAGGSKETFIYATSIGWR